MLSNNKRLCFRTRYGIVIAFSLFLVSQSLAQHQETHIKFSETGSAIQEIPSLNGNKIRIQLEKPKSDGPFPVLIGVEGGDGFHAFHRDTSKQILEAVNALNILAVDFAPQGRSGSEGEDNYHGFVHQDDLKAIVDYLTKQPFVNNDMIGILTISYGVALATGALSRYPDMPIQFLIDWEGPAAPGRDIRRAFANKEAWIKNENVLSMLKKDEITSEKELHAIVLHGGKIGNDAYWDERDASLFAARLSCPYLRIQGHIDHVQGTSKAAMMAIINAATSHSGQWTRCNDNPPNTIYKEQTLSQYHFHEEDIGIVINTILPKYIEEMFFQKPWK